MKPKNTGTGKAGAVTAYRNFLSICRNGDKGNSSKKQRLSNMKVLYGLVVSLYLDNPDNSPLTIFLGV